MIDVHLIPHPDFDPTPTIEALDHPDITVQIGQFVPGNVLEASLQAYKMGTNPYVSWVDADGDKVLDVSWVPEALKMLEDPKIVAVYPMWKCYDYVTSFKPWDRKTHWQLEKYGPKAHHLTIMRREPVIELLEQAKKEVGHLISKVEIYLMGALGLYGDFASIDAVAYEWVIRSGSARTFSDDHAKRWLYQQFLKYPKCSSLEQS